ncbi:unnamed protein product [Lampetra planeri]
MSKHLKKKNSPVASSDVDEAGTQDLPTPGSMVPVTGTAAGEVTAPETDGAAAASSPQRAEDGWKRVEEQLDSLRTMLLQLVFLVASSMVTGHPQEVLPRGDEQRLRDGASEGPPAESMAAIAGAGELSAITHATETMRRDAAILGGTVGARLESAISEEPRGEQPVGAAAVGWNGAERSSRLPQVKEFVTAGGDWSAFTWSFEAAFRSLHWSEEEALVALPTVLDDDALVVFRRFLLRKRKR